MNDFLYMFGFETPDERESNDKHGTDFETCRWFRIFAQSEDEALGWGHKLAAWFLGEVYGPEFGDWTPDQFAAWIEHEPDPEMTIDFTTLPLVTTRDYPDLAQTRAYFEL